MLSLNAFPSDVFTEQCLCDLYLVINATVFEISLQDLITKAKHFLLNK